MAGDAFSCREAQGQINEEEVVSGGGQQEDMLATTDLADQIEAIAFEMASEHPSYSQREGQ